MLVVQQTDAASSITCSCTCAVMLGSQIQSASPNEPFFMQRIACLSTCPKISSARAGRRFPISCCVDSRFRVFTASPRKCYTYSDPDSAHAASHACTRIGTGSQRRAQARLHGTQMCCTARSAHLLPTATAEDATAARQSSASTDASSVESSDAAPTKVHGILKGTTLNPIHMLYACTPFAE